MFVCVHKWTVSNPQTRQQIVYVCDLKDFHLNTNSMYMYIIVDDHAVMSTCTYSLTGNAMIPLLHHPPLNMLPKEPPMLILTPSNTRLVLKLVNCMQWLPSQVRRRRRISNLKKIYQLTRYVYTHMHTYS